MTTIGQAFLRVRADTSGLRNDVEDEASQAGEGSGQSFSAKFLDKIKSLPGSMKAGLAGAGALLVAGFTSAFQQNASAGTLQAKLGLSPAESKKLASISGKIYANNWGDSLDDVNQAVTDVKTGLGNLVKDSDLQGLTTKALAFKKTFGVETSDSIRAVSQMIKTGLAKNAKQAFDILTTGEQTGADKAGDLIDTFNEYGTQFRKLGIDGPHALGLINQGLQNGARDSDLVADAIKEFSIRAVDGSKTTIQGFQMIGLNAQQMAEKIGKGGKSANEGLQQVLDGLRNIQDPVKRAQAATDLFGTQAEDLGAALFHLNPATATAGKGMDKLNGSTDRMSKAIGGTANPLESMKRALMGGVASLSKALMPAVKTATDFINNNAVPAIQSVSGFLQKNWHWLKYVAGAALAMFAAYKGYKAVTGALDSITSATRTFMGGIGKARLAVTNMMNTTITKARGAGAALAGLAAGTAIGQLTKDSNGATKAVGALGATASGAAAGFAMGGPWGAAIGGATGLISDLASAFGGTSKRAKQLNEDADNLTQAFIQNAGAVTQDVRALAAKALQDAGVLDTAKQYGISLGLVTDAALGNKGALQKLMATENALIDSGKASSHTFEGMNFQLTLTSATSADASAKGKQLAEATRESGKQAGYTAGQNKTLDKTLGGLFDSWHKAAGTIGDNTDKVDKNTDAQGKSKTALDKTSTSMKNQTSAADRLSQTLDKLSGQNIDAAQAELRFKDGLGQATQQVQDNGRSLSANTQKGRANREWLLDQITSLNDVANAQAKADGNTKRASRTLAANERALRHAAIAAGLDKDQVQHLIDKYAAVPRTVRTRLSSNAGQVAGQLDSVYRQVENLVNGSYRIYIGVDVAGGRAPVHAMASGGMTTGKRLILAGDNPSGQEAILPMDSPNTIGLFAKAFETASRQGGGGLPASQGITSADLDRVVAAMDRVANRPVVIQVGEREIARANTLGTQLRSRAL